MFAAVLLRIAANHAHVFAVVGQPLEIQGHGLTAAPFAVR